MNDNYKNDIDLIHESTEKFIEHKKQYFINECEKDLPKKKNSDSDDDQLEYLYKNEKDEEKKTRDTAPNRGRGYELQIDSPLDINDIQLGD